MRTAQGKSILDLNFSCTQCGRCCHDLRLMLGMGEAVAWLDDGGAVQVLCDAAPAVHDPDQADAAAAARHARSFTALSGSLPLSVNVLLVAAFDGPCPNLLPDLRCGIYARRPQTCRIYPAEMRPGVIPRPEDKQCPPEAWTPDRPPFVTDGLIRDPDVARAVATARSTAGAEASAVAALCALLGIDVAALTNEGLTVSSPDPADLRAALFEVMRDRPVAPERNWTIATNRRSTCDMVVSAGGNGRVIPGGAPEYLGFFSPE